MLKKINSKIEDLFDQKSDTLESHNINYPDNEIQLIQNNKMLENLSYVFSSEVNSKNIANIFSQLSSYFEIGFLIKKNNTKNQYEVVQGFMYQQQLEETELLNLIQHPQAPLFHVLKTDGTGLLKHLGISSNKTSEKISSFLIPISTRYSLIFLTEIAEPWAGLKIETLQKTLMKINFSL